MELGTFADWVTAMATVAMVVVAGITLKTAFWTHRTAERRYRREKDLDRRHLATGIHAWVATHTDEGGRWLMISNQSGAPVYSLHADVIINGQDHTAPGKKRPWEILPQGVYAVQHDPPETQFPWALPEPVPDVSVYRPYANSKGFRVRQIDFKDANGKHWVRHGDGGLRLQDSVDT